MKKTIGLFIVLLFALQVCFAINNRDPFNYNPGTNNRAYVSLYNFFKSYDTVILKALMKIPADELLNNNSNLQYMVDKNRELIGILSELRPATYNAEQMNPNDEMIVYAGLIELCFEVGNTQQTFVSMRCILDVVAAAFSVKPLLESIETMIRQGVTWGGLRSFLWRALKRYGGWIAVAGVIYDIYDHCF